LKFDRSKTLQELENSDWGEPQNNSSLESAILHLRRVPLSEIKGDELVRMLIQHVGLEYLIPMALEQLHVDPLADRDWHSGSLLGAVLTSPYEYWKKHPDLLEEVERIYQQVLANKNNDIDLDKSTIRYLKQSYLFFSEFGPYISLLWDNERVKKTCNRSAVEILAIIASRQPITLEDLESLQGSQVSQEMIEALLKDKFIIYNYEGPYPANRYFRLSKSLIKPR